MLPKWRVAPMAEIAPEPQDRMARRRQLNNQTAAARRRQALDLRTRVGRRQRQIERELEQELVKIGRKPTIHDQILVANLAQLLMQLEIWRGPQSRGEQIDNEELTRVANASQRLIAALGLKPEVAEQPEVLDEYLAKKYGAAG
jgi:hypothetical protein